MQKNTISERLISFITLPAVGPLIALIIAIIFFSTYADNFLTLRNFSFITQQVMVIGTLAIGQTLVILTRGIDLSNGLIMAFGSVLMTSFAVHYGINPYLAILMGLAITTALGTCNGLLITRFNLPPFIVTLGVWNIVFALTRIYTSSTVVGLPDEMLFLGETILVGESAYAYGTFLMVLLYLIVWHILTNTPVGRHIYALGDNPEAARLTGISTKKLLVCVYAFTGFIYGVGGLLLAGRTGVGDPQAGQTDNLESITAVVLGGTSLFGGRGNILGTLIGVLIVGVFRNGLQLMGVPSIYQVLITGILVILAVGVDQFGRSRKQR